MNDYMPNDDVVEEAVTDPGHCLEGDTWRRWLAAHDEQVHAEAVSDLVDAMVCPGMAFEDAPDEIVDEVQNRLKVKCAKAYAEGERAAAERVAEAARHPHKGPHDTDASMLREAAKRLDGGYEAGGSNTRQTVARVLRTVADLIGEDQ